MEKAMTRKQVSSGSYLEPEIGFSRAVRVGNIIAVSGTAPLAEEGGTASPGDVPCFLPSRHGSDHSHFS